MDKGKRTKDEALIVIVPHTGPITQIFGLDRFSTSDIDAIIARLQSVSAYLKQS